MAAATNEQVQAFCDARVRPHSELIRSVITAFTDDIANIDDIYQNLVNSPTWKDSNPSNLPHTATPEDVLAWNAFVQDIKVAMTGHASYPVISKLCRTPA